jgi:hypothetical protein
MFATPSHDRWHYPFNGTNGYRAVGSIFGAVGNPGFNDRDAMFMAAWDTNTSIPAGQGAHSYNIFSVQLNFSNIESAGWCVDMTVDEWFTYDVNRDTILNADGVPRGQPGDTDGESDDPDPGCRPIELYGMGFTTYTPATWTESSPYIGGDGGAQIARDPYPLTFDPQTGDPLHVEDNVKGLHNGPTPEPFTPQPWAIGEPQNYTPNMQTIPFDITFDVDLDLAAGAVRRYVQEQLNNGRLFFAVTSLLEVDFMGANTNYPVFFTREGYVLNPLAHSPELRIVTCGDFLGDFDSDCDVDSDDADIMRDCHTGPMVVPPASGCEGADLDADQDVDQSDFAGLQRCFSGEGLMADVSCLLP